ncbi:MAG: N-acetyltransferase family protein [Acidimicrobiia bacterium]
MNVDIRRARASDLVRINVIYEHTVVGSAISFDLEPWDMERRHEWWTHYSDTGPYRVFVAEVDGHVVGTAYSSEFRDKAAYQTSVETTVVIDPDYRAAGIGRRLLSTVLDAVRSEGIHRAYAVVTLPNDASIGLHESLGYRLVGTLDEVGYKLGAYWTTAILEIRLDSDGG